MKDIIIIGAGVVGLSIARLLAKYNVEVCVIEKDGDVSNGVSKANSGIIHGGFDDKYGSQKAKYCPSGSAYFEELDSELHFGYRKIGSFVLAYDSTGDDTVKFLHENAKKNGVITSILSKQEFLKEEPNLNNEHLTSALFSPNSGVVSPYEYGIALAENFVANDGHLVLNSEVVSISKTDAGFEVVTKSNGKQQTYTAKVVINCAGLNCDVVSGMLKLDDFKVSPRKGEYVLFDRGTGSLVNKVIFQCPTKMGKGILVSPTYHGNLLIGPDAQEIEDKYDTNTDLDSLSKIISLAKHLLPSLPVPKTITTFSGVRPVVGSGDFQIREKVSGFIETIGIASPGLTSSPAIAIDIVDNFISKHITLTKKTNFVKERRAIIKCNVDRMFLNPVDLKRAVELDLSDPECIVCRCEQVSRKTIDDAFSRPVPPKTTEGLRKRTRAGMGFCNGDFCKPRVKKIISEKLGVAEEDVKERNDDLKPHKVDKAELIRLMKTLQ